MTATGRHVCVHGHFYQPPRENPWLEAVEVQDSAYPYHDWNERITAECYAPNARARILDPEGRIQAIVNNYSRMSFDFGPTLLSWLEVHAPETYRAVVEADAESRRRLGGRGSAMAQVYNHPILPLCDARDRRTQVRWGVADFRHRFGRAPEGMWLSETAVDLASLEALAAEGIRYTVLAPHQARRVRPPGQPWRTLAPGAVDTTRPYRARLPSQRSIDLFFYDGAASGSVAFEGLLRSGAELVRRLLASAGEGPGPRLGHIAVDGETYGHHHRFGDMALAWALDRIERDGTARLTHYPAFLDAHPPEWEVEVAEGTSWSCAHGLERWRADCGCASGSHPGWRQAWRGPLREALDWLRDRLAPLYEREAARHLRDPWEARDAYVGLVLDRSDEALGRFLADHARGRPGEDAAVQTLRLLEMERNALLMYTSCGWFFDDVSGIETAQVIAYAARAAQLAREACGVDLEGDLGRRLEAAPSNIPEQGDGRRVYERHVRPTMADLSKVAVHHAVSALFGGPQGPDRLPAYTVERDPWRVREAGRSRLATGRLRVRSLVTREAADLEVGVLHFGDHNLRSGVRPWPARGPGAPDPQLAAMEEAFARGEVPEVQTVLERRYPGATFSLRSLFRDGQRRVLDRLMADTLEDAEAACRALHERHAALVRFLADAGSPVPAVLRATSELYLDSTLRRACEADEPEVDRIGLLLDEARSEGVRVDAEGLAFALRGTLDRMLARLARDPRDPALARRVSAAVRLARSLPTPVDLWGVQNAYWGLLEGLLERAAGPGSEWAAPGEAFLDLGRALGIRVDP
ncbi:MAG: DUF3536 domain-containing protein [Planctomycetes bacterium]|nr:DUF3536 domain-containing protein [Planctomycetota bacterium]